LLKKLQDVEVNFHSTDHCRVFAEVLPKEKHIICKEYTRIYREKTPGLEQD